MQQRNTPPSNQYSSKRRENMNLDGGWLHNQWAERKTLVVNEKRENTYILTKIKRKEEKSENTNQKRFIAARHDVFVYMFILKATSDKTHL